MILPIQHKDEQAQQELNPKLSKIISRNTIREGIQNSVGLQLRRLKTQFHNQAPLKSGIKPELPEDINFDKSRVVLELKRKDTISMD